MVLPISPMHESWIRIPEKNHYKQKHNSRLSPRHAAKLKIKDIKRFSIYIIHDTISRPKTNACNSIKWKARH